MGVRIFERQPCWKRNSGIEARKGPDAANSQTHPPGFESSALHGRDDETTRRDTAADLKSLVVIWRQRARADVGAELQGLVVIVGNRTRADVGAELQGLVVIVGQCTRADAGAELQRLSLGVHFRFSFWVEIAAICDRSSGQEPNRRKVAHGFENYSCAALDEHAFTMSEANSKSAGEILLLPDSRSLASPTRARSAETLASAQRLAAFCT